MLDQLDNVCYLMFSSWNPRKRRCILKEIQEFGLNQATLSSLGVMIFGIIGAYGQWRQAFLAYLVQGLHTESAIMSIQGGLRAVFYLPIVGGIVAFEYSKISRRDFTFFAVLVAGIVVMVFTHEWKSLIFQLFGYLGVVMALDQPFQIWKNKSRGKVSITMLITFTSAVVFWTWYAWVFDDMRLFWLSLSFVLVYLFTIVIWRKYRQG